jgi:hypothetical protein
MREERIKAPFYVIKAEELRALNHLCEDFPRPQGLEWIDRGRNSRLRRSSIDMLIRTLYRGTARASVCRLHDRSGLRLIFSSDEDRRKFAAAFKLALAAVQEASQ